MFCVVDLLQRCFDSFFVPEPLKESSLYHNVQTMLEQKKGNPLSSDNGTVSSSPSSRHLCPPHSATTQQHYNIRRQRTPFKTQTSEEDAHKKTLAKLHKWQKLHLPSKSSSSYPSTYPAEDNIDVQSALKLLVRMVDIDSSLRLRPLHDIKTFMKSLQSICDYNHILFRRMQLFYCCVHRTHTTTEDLPTTQACMDKVTTRPTFASIVEAPPQVLSHLWNWCVLRKTSQADLGCAGHDPHQIIVNNNHHHANNAAATRHTHHRTQMIHHSRCEHTNDLDQTSEAYIANMFILRDRENALTSSHTLELVHLPYQYDELYSQHVHGRCRRCQRTPREPGLCLICGVLLCCGESCCSYTHEKHGPSMGECSRHALECGGGLGIVLMLQQCRVVVLGGSLAAYFPCPYVDAHGEEDHGLQRGRPLKLDENRYALLESLWRSHRLFAEISRLRNQRENHQPLNLTYI